MKEMHHKMGHHMDGMHHMHSGHAMYRNEVEKPPEPPFNHISAMENVGEGMHEFKGECDPIAYGQASEEGCRSDKGKIHSQFKDYHWD